jgi:hypothetical protein
MTAVSLVFSARQDGRLQARYAEYAQVKQMMLPDDESLLRRVLCQFEKDISCWQFLFDDESLVRTTSLRRRALQKALSAIAYGCELCGDHVAYHHTDGVGEVHGYCSRCYLTRVKYSGHRPEIGEHPGYNVGNWAVLESEARYHGSGYIDDYN